VRLRAWLADVQLSPRIRTINFPLRPPRLRRDLVDGDGLCLLERAYPDRPAFYAVRVPRCRVSPRASFPPRLTTTQLPPARSEHHLFLQGTFTPNRSPIPGVLKSGAAARHRWPGVSGGLSLGGGPAERTPGHCPQDIQITMAQFSPLPLARGASPGQGEPSCPQRIRRRSRRCIPAAETGDKGRPNGSLNSAHGPVAAGTVPSRSLML
jgi:hypothetical protein